VESSGAFPFAGEALEEDAAGGQSGEGIAVGQLAELALQLQDPGPGPHPRQELRPMDRLAHELIGAHVQSGDRLVGRALGGEEEDEHVMRQVQPAHPAAQLQAVHVRHVPVGDEEVRAFRLHGLQGLAPVAHLAHAVARPLQPRREEPQHHRVVVDQQHPVAAGIGLFRGHEHRATQSVTKTARALACEP